MRKISVFEFKANIKNNKDLVNAQFHSKSAIQASLSDIIYIYTYLSTFRTNQVGESPPYQLDL